jgi:DNA-binding response OmpR family regulator
MVGPQAVGIARQLPGAAGQILEVPLKFMKHKIMLVEDEQSLSDLLREAFATRGYDVLLADGQEASNGPTEMAEADVLVLDLDLNNGMAWNLLAEWITFKPVVCTILLTETPSRVETARLVGADAVMQKPVELSLLLKTTEELLAARAQGWEALRRGDANCRYRSRTNRRYLRRIDPNGDGANRISTNSIPCSPVEH